MGEAAMQRATRPAARTHGHEQRQEMLVARVGLPRLRLRLAVANQGFLVAGFDPLRQPRLECHRPGRRSLAIELELPQIVDGAAAGEDQNVLIAQRPQRPAQTGMVRRTEMRLDR